LHKKSKTALWRRYFAAVTANASVGLHVIYTVACFCQCFRMTLPWITPQRKWKFHTGNENFKTKCHFQQQGLQGVELCFDSGFRRKSLLAQ